MKFVELFWEPVDIERVLGGVIYSAIHAAHLFWERLSLPQQLLITIAGHMKNTLRIYTISPIVLLGMLTGLSMPVRAGETTTSNAEAPSLPAAPSVPSVDDMISGGSGESEEMSEDMSTDTEMTTEETTTEPVEDPAAEAPVEDPATETFVEEPAAETPTDMTTEEPVEEPAAETPVEEPAVETPMEEPASEAPVEDLSPEASTDETTPTEQSSLSTQTVAEAPIEAPAVEAPIEAPAVEAPIEEPAAETPVEEPAAETPVEEPAAETPIEEPAAETPIEEPAAETPVEEVSPEASTDEATPTDEGTASSTTIVDVASSNESFSTLVAAIEAAGLKESLMADGAFTVFAPTNEAFAALPPGVLDALLQPENQAILAKVLTHHVVGDKLMSSDLSTQEVTSLADSPLQVTVDDAGVGVDDAKVLQADVAASNGVIHIIDKVLIPQELQQAPQEQQ